MNHTANSCRYNLPKIAYSIFYFRRKRRGYDFLAANSDARQMRGQCVAGENDTDWQKDIEKTET
jgi:hypothetical protein